MGKSKDLSSDVKIIIIRNYEATQTPYLFIIIIIITRKKKSGKTPHIFAKIYLYDAVGSLWGRSQVSLFFASVVSSVKGHFCKYGVCVFQNFELSF
jgi:hypothetical protein